MSVEAKRGCGYRKIGGTYLVAEGQGFSCGRFPLVLTPCPLCDHRPPFTRGLQRITPRTVLHASPVCKTGSEERCSRCPLGAAIATDVGGLMWVGGRFYPTPESFTLEAGQLGVSKRIPSLPKWFKLGVTWVFLAHKKGIDNTIKLGPSGELLEAHDAMPAVFFAFQPTRVERIVPDTMPEAELETLRKQGLTPVAVPADDPDHQGRGSD